jgi:predicted phosphoribosyltransferase
VVVTFRDRTDAGRRLAQELDHLAGPDVVVLALPRGGVPVAFEVARALGAPLDVFVVRKLGAPGRRELAIGAIASGGVKVVNEPLARALGIAPRTIDALAVEESRELERRERSYRGDRPPLDLRGKVVVLADDGLATGASMLAAVTAVEKLGPARIVVAVPVGAEDTILAFRARVSEVVVLHVPDPLGAIGLWYDDFSQTTDDEVRALLERSREPRREAA